MEGTFIVVLLFETIQFVAAAYEEEDNAEEEILSEDGIGAEDHVFLFFMFAFFGLVVSLFGSFLAYVSCVEDQIMKDYVRNGITIEGYVVSTHFTRGVGRNEEAFIKFDNQKEYFVTVEYILLIAANYPVKVQKQLRVMESEFYEYPSSDDDELQNSKSISLFQDPCSTCNSNMDDDTREMTVPYPHQQTKSRIEIVTSAESFVKKFQSGKEKKLHLLALPQHPLSALPVRQVERRITPKHRLYSILFVLAAISISVFCYHVATQFLLAVVNAPQSSSSSESAESFFTQERAVTRNGLFYLLYLAFALLPIPCIHFCLRGAILSSLQQEFFENGDIIRGGLEDDGSYSTWNTGSLGGFKLSIGSLSTLAQQSSAVSIQYLASA